MGYDLLWLQRRMKRGYKKKQSMKKRRKERKRAKERRGQCCAQDGVGSNNDNLITTVEHCRVEKLWGGESYSASYGDS